MEFRKPQVKQKYYSRLMDLYRESPLYIPFLNSLMRLAVTIKSNRDRKILKKKYSGRESMIKEWHESHTLFFGFAVVRSGTTFLADFLNKNLPNVIVQHEPNLNDYLYYAKALQSPAEALKYIKEYRLIDIYDRVHQFPVKIYGEVNPFLRRHSAALKQLCPMAKQFHLVRDGREVLRSLMSRQFLGPKHPWAPLIYPPEGDSFQEEWKELSRFEKICWLWKSDNEYLHENVPHLIHFEKLISDYDYFKTSLIDYLNIGMISSDIWQKDVEKIVNQTPGHRFPPFREWKPEQKKDFRKDLWRGNGHFGILAIIIRHQIH